MRVIYSKPATMEYEPPRALYLDGRRFFTPPRQKMVGDQSWPWQKPGRHQSAGPVEGGMSQDSGTTWLERFKASLRPSGLSPDNEVHERLCLRIQRDADQQHFSNWLAGMQREWDLHEEERTWRMVAIEGPVPPVPERFAKTLKLGKGVSRKNGL